MTAAHPKTFAQLFCEQNQLPLADFEQAIIAEALHPQARALRRLLQLVPGEYFATDMEFIRQVGQLTRPGDFGWEVADFHAHPANRQVLRRRLKLRLSIARLRRIVIRTFKESTAEIAA